MQRTLWDFEQFLPYCSHCSPPQNWKGWGFLPQRDPEWCFIASNQLQQGLRGSGKTEGLDLDNVFTSAVCTILNSPAGPSGHRTKFTIARMLKGALGARKTHRNPSRSCFPEHLFFNSGFWICINIYLSLLGNKNEHNFNTKCIFSSCNAQWLTCQPKVTDDQELKETAAAGLFPLFTAAPFFHFPVDENYRYRLSYLHKWWAIFLFAAKSLPTQKFYLSKQTRPKPNKANKGRNTASYESTMHWYQPKLPLGGVQT